MIPYSILIAEDDHFLAETINKILQELELNCTIVHSGTAVLEEYQSAYYDLVLLDIMMPGLNGFETAEAIRKTNSYIPIIAFTSLDFKEIEDKIAKSGINHYLKKPTEVRELRKLLLGYFAKAA